MDKRRAKTTKKKSRAPKPTVADVVGNVEDNSGVLAEPLLGPPSPTRFFSAFIAASRYDGRFAYALNESLRAAGVPATWFAETNVTVDVPIEEQILQAVAQFDRMLFVVSESIYESRGLQYEASLAIRKERETGEPFLIPLLLRGGREHWQRIVAQREGPWRELAPALGQRIPIEDTERMLFSRDPRGLRQLLDRLTIPQSTDPPRPLVEAVRSVSAELVQRIKVDPSLLYQIGSRTFEELVAELLAQYGWQVQLTPPSKDGGFDIFAVSKDIAGARTSWIVECKRYAADRPVGIEIANALYGVKSQMGGMAANAMIATTSTFTKGVMDLKAKRYDFDAKAFGDVVEWVNEYRPHPGGKLYVRDSNLVVPKMAITM